MKINALLNPQPEDSWNRRAATMPHRSVPGKPDDSLNESDFASPTPKPKAKDAKDAPKFDRGEPVGEIRFKPFEAETLELQRQHAAFKIYPAESIEAYPRHIPYKSDKKELLIKTGRDSFEVFQYTFKYRENDHPDHRVVHHSSDKDWTVMWDYNIGLVRITPFFKCQSYAKTIPAKVIGQNPGLKELCFSITGGALAAQGYWMPYAAARALAATFCWKIRFALTPLFGDDFVDLCVHPSDPAYKQFIIDPDITKQCEEEMYAWKNGGGHRRRASKANKHTVNMPLRSESPLRNHVRKARLRGLAEHHDGYVSVANQLALYEDTPLNELSLRGHWTAVNSPSSSMVKRKMGKPPSLKRKLFQESMPSPTTPSTKRTFPKLGEGNQDTETSASEVEAMSPPKRREVGRYGIDEIRAAYALLQMRYGYIVVSP